MNRLILVSMLLVWSMWSCTSTSRRRLGSEPGAGGGAADMDAGAGLDSAGDRDTAGDGALGPLDAANAEEDGGSEAEDDAGIADAANPPQRRDASRPSPCDPSVLGDWEGDFDGSVNSDLGSTQVFGDIRFTIECSDRKLEVHGEMDGTGNVAFPYQARVEGFVNPTTHRLEADLIDGEVNMIVGIVTFEGSFEGTLLDGRCEDGEWGGTSIDPPFLQATGEGTWRAELQP